MVDTCIIVSNTVTGICKMVMNRSAKMTCDKPMVVAVVNAIHRNTFRNILVMANWSRAMWQSVMNRAIRVLALGPVWIAFILGN
ncbi:hypothetical protein KIN20_017363 [Parelaphostrongylus tenuis]|uniref:Uncharacterized protein n=1 Tax=Parelaphostrongylus tenuis TaxID=148309 RepID=A0AAD5MHU9_PARTN|nr:hypothetical protein KIN20_017363 [Parelaphostrongylus tenuis]